MIADDVLLYSLSPVLPPDNGTLAFWSIVKMKKS
jgi:hypothetical protein